MLKIMLTMGALLGLFAALGVGEQKNMGTMAPNHPSKAEISESPFVEHFTVLQIPEVTISVPAHVNRPQASAEKTWTCGAPSPLASDYRATVRRCEYL